MAAWRGSRASATRRAAAAVLGATSGSVSGSDDRNRRHCVSAIGCECTRASASMLAPGMPTSTCGTGSTASSTIASVACARTS